MNTPAEEVSRKAFEDMAFAVRFIHSIKKVGKGPMTLQPVNCPTQAQFVRRDKEGTYLDHPLQVMWEVWCKALAYANA